MALPTRKYYVLVRGKKFSDTQVIQVTSNNRINAENELRAKGHRVLYAFSFRALTKVKRLSESEFFETRPQWPAETYQVIQNLKEEHQ